MKFERCDYFTSRIATKQKPPRTAFTRGAITGKHAIVHVDIRYFDDMFDYAGEALLNKRAGIE